MRLNWKMTTLLFCVTATLTTLGTAAGQTASIPLTADGTYQIAGSGSINGIYTIDWYGPYRAEHYQVAVVAHQFSVAAVTIINGSTYSSPPVLSNFRVVGDAAADSRYFVVDVANRNGGTGAMTVTATGATAVLSLSATPAGSTPISNSVLSLNNAQSGNVGIGTTAPGAKLEVSGNVKLTAGSGASMTYQDGSIQTVAWNGVLGGGDYAESVDVVGDRTQYEPGDVLVIDPASKGRFMKSTEAYSTGVMGIYSTRPGVVGRRQKTDKSHMKDEVPMAMVGVVPTKVSAESGAIKPGDLLVTSSKPGYAMKGTDRTLLTGAIIGKALEPLDAGIGVIEVAVSIQ